FGQRLARSRWRRFAAPALPRPPPRIPHCRLAEGARGLLGPRLELRFRFSNRADVLFGPGAFRALSTSIELPGGDDDFLLGRDQIVNAAARAGAGHRRALSQRKFLLERLHFEKEDVAARLVRTGAARDVASANVIGNEVARFDFEVFEKERMVSVDRGVLAGNLQRYHLLFVSPDGIHQVEPI